MLRRCRYLWWCRTGTTLHRERHVCPLANGTRRRRSRSGSGAVQRARRHSQQAIAVQLHGSLLPTHCGQVLKDWRTPLAVNPGPHRMHLIGLRYRTAGVIAAQAKLIRGRRGSRCGESAQRLRTPQTLNSGPRLTGSEFGRPALWECAQYRLAPTCSEPSRRQ